MINPGKSLVICLAFFCYLGALWIFGTHGAVYPDARPGDFLGMFVTTTVLVVVVVRTLRKRS